jgi:pyridoxine 4-dehydrogenase
MASTHLPAASSGVYSIGGGLPVTRLGYGAMRITGRGVWGEPADPGEAIAVLRRAAELGVDFIDTADSYGPFVSEDLIRKALHPYGGIAIATKGGFVRTGPDQWHPVGRPEYLRQCVEMSLRLNDMRKEGKIRYLGLSEVSVAQIGEARLTAPVSSVQNLYNLVSRKSEDVLDYCEREGLAFIPWFPIATGRLASADGPLSALAKQAGATPAQLALAWLLHRSPVMLPIPGTGSVEHLEENVASADIELSDAQFEEMSRMS